MTYHYINGEYVPAEEAVIPVSDLAVLRGYAVFDFLRTYNKVPFFIDAHLSRLERSAKLAGIKMPVSDEEIYNVIMDLLDMHAKVENELSFRVIITGGDSYDNLNPTGKSRLLVLTGEVRPPDPIYYDMGARAITVHDERYSPAAKTINYMPAILAMQSALRQDASEILYVDRYDRILEGSTTNFFGVIDDTLITAGSHVLPGITRHVVVELALDAEILIEVRDVRKEELRLFDEAFITSSTKGVFPIVNIDGINIGDGRVGEITKRLMRLFKEYTQNYGSEEKA